MASLDFIQEMLPGPLKTLPTHMDYKGQQIAERIFQVLIAICAIAGFIVGFIYQRYSYTVYFALGGFFLSCLIILPPWPVFRVRKDLVWQKVLEEKKPTDDSTQSKQSKSTTKKKN